MGMFDSLYDEQGNEWQTKAFDCDLDEYELGDTIPADCAATYQVEVLHGRGSTIEGTHELLESYATVRGSVLVEVPAHRDASLPLLDYSGRMVSERR